jgi:hypothetical protein
MTVQEWAVKHPSPGAALATDCSGVGAVKYWSLVGAAMATDRSRAGGVKYQSLRAAMAKL